MSPHDFLDGEDPRDDAAGTSRRQARRAGKRQRKAARAASKAEARSDYRSKLRDARQAPRSPLALLIVGVLFFGAIIVAGTVAGGHSATTTATHSPSSSTVPSARASSSNPTPTAPSTATATAAAGGAQTIASKWLIAYFAGENWQQYAAPDATAGLTATRGPFFNGTYLQGDSVRIQEYTWRDVKASAGAWTGTVDVMLDPGRTVPLVASLKVSMSAGASPQVTSASTLYYGEGQD